MILVLANRVDEEARLFIERGSPREAQLLTPQDLSEAGWNHRPSEPGAGTAVAMGARFPVSELEGVLVRSGGISAMDLPQLHPADRAYAAAEMTAFLSSWLCSLPCPVLNQPSPGCLLGPALRHEQWIHLAAQLGIPVVPVKRTSAGYAAPTGLPGPSLVAAVIGEECVAGAAPELAEQAVRIARAAQVSLLEVYFVPTPSGPLFAGANLCPRLEKPAICDAIWALLRRRPQRGSARKDPPAPTGGRKQEKGAGP